MHKQNQLSRTEGLGSPEAATRYVEGVVGGLGPGLIAACHAALASATDRESLVALNARASLLNKTLEELRVLIVNSATLLDAHGHSVDIYGLAHIVASIVAFQETSWQTLEAMSPRDLHDTRSRIMGRAALRFLADHKATVGPALLTALAVATDVEPSTASLNEKQKRFERWRKHLKTLRNIDSQRRRELEELARTIAASDASTERLE